MTKSPALKLAGYPLSLAMPLLAPLGIRMGLPWLASMIVFGVFPVLGLMVGEDRSLPSIGLRKSRALVAYLEFLPRIYALVWVMTLVWVARYSARSDLSVGAMLGLI